MRAKSSFTLGKTDMKLFCANIRYFTLIIIILIINSRRIAIFHEIYSNIKHNNDLFIQGVMSMSGSIETTNKKPMSYWIHTAIVLLFMVGFGFLPPLGGDITPFGMRVLGIFIGTFWGWIFIEFMWPSLLGIVLLGLTEYGTVGSVFTEGIMNVNTLNILLMYCFAAYLQHCGTLDYVTYWMISRKSLVGKPWLFTFVFIFAIVPISLFVNIYAGLVILWAMFGSLCDKLGLTKKDLYCAYVITGTAAIGGLVNISFPFQPFAQLVFGLTGASTLPFMQWSATGVLPIILFPIAYFILGKYILRVDVSKVAAMGDQFASYRDQKMNIDQKFGAVLLLIFIGFLVGPSFTSGAVQAFLNKFNLMGASIVSLILAFIWQHARGTKFFSFDNMVSRGVSWDLIILFVVTFPLCTAMESAEAGVINTVVALIMPVVEAVSPTVFLVIVCILFCLLTQVSHNLVLIIALTPSLAKIAMGVGIDPILFGLVFVQSTMISVATPAASAQAAMVFGNELVERKYGFLCGVTTMIVFLIVQLGIILPIAKCFIF